MATLTAKLTLSSSDSLSDSINLSLTKSFTTTIPAEMSRVTVLHTGPTEFAAATTGTHYVYIKNIGTNSRVVEIRTAGGTSFGQLATDEFCFVPLLNNAGVEAISLVGSEVVEYAIFKKA